jgi:hypothetical protein
MFPISNLPLGFFSIINCGTRNAFTGVKAVLIELVVIDGTDARTA